MANRIWVLLLCAGCVLRTAECEDTWRSASNGKLPCNGVVGGTDGGQPVYVIRAHTDKGLLPGKLVARLNQAYVPFNNKEYKVDNYEVLCDHGYYGWRHYSIAEHRPTANDVIGGHSAVNRDALYVCKWRGSVGKFHPRHNACFFPYGGKEDWSREFHVLFSG